MTLGPEDARAVRVDQEERHFTALRKWEFVRPHKERPESSQFYSQFVAGDDQLRELSNWR